MGEKKEVPVQNSKPIMWTLDPQRVEHHSPLLNCGLHMGSTERKRGKRSSLQC